MATCRITRPSEAKEVVWIGSSKEDLTAFPVDVRSELGKQLRKVQFSEPPDDFSPMTTVGQGAYEIRERDADGWFRVIIALRGCEEGLRTMTSTTARKSRPGVSHVTRSTDNLFSDIGFPPAVARKLQAETDALIFERMRLREQLADELNEWMAVQDVTQEELSRALKISRPRVSDLARRQLAKFSIDTLVDLVLRTGKRVEIRVA